MAASPKPGGERLIGSSSHVPNYSSISQDPSPPFHPTAEGSHSTLPPPPSYALYRASAQEIRKNGDLVSHDAHLNDDGEALARFLIQQAEQAPSIRILCQGTHTQTTTSSRMSGDVSGAFNSEDGTTNEVVDFKFIISVPVPLNSDQEGGNRPVLWSVGDMEPVFRGGSHREVDTQNGRCAAVTDDTRRWREVRETRRLKGLPPWGGQGAWKSSKSLREWADAYCADREEGLKEFVFEKVVHGWDISRLEESLRSIIREAGYWSGDVKVEISTHASRVIIRPNRYSSRLVTDYVSDTSVCEHIVQAIAGLAVFVLLVFILVTLAFGNNRPLFASFATWPFPGNPSPQPAGSDLPLLLFAGLLLFLVLFLIGGCVLNKLIESGTRRWSVCGAAYSLVPAEISGTSLQDQIKLSFSSSQDQETVSFPSGQDSWLAQWKPAVKAGVRRGLVFSEVLTSPGTLLQ